MEIGGGMDRADGAFAGGVERLKDVRMVDLSKADGLEGGRMMPRSMTIDGAVAGGPGGEDAVKGVEAMRNGASQGVGVPDAEQMAGSGGGW